MRCSNAMVNGEMKSATASYHTTYQSGKMYRQLDDTVRTWAHSNPHVQLVVVQTARGILERNLAPLISIRSAPTQWPRPFSPGIYAGDILPETQDSFLFTHIVFYTKRVHMEGLKIGVRKWKEIHEWMNGMRREPCQVNGDGYQDLKSSLMPTLHTSITAGGG